MADFLDIDSRHLGSEIDRAFYAGVESDFVFGQGTAIFSRAPMAIYGVCDTRTVLDSNERWFEFCFRMDQSLSGNAAAGWTDAGNYFRLEPQFSVDLVNWSMGKFVPAPTPIVAVADGQYEHWARCVHPIDSAVKSAQVGIKSVTQSTNQPFEMSADARNNPFTALTVKNVALALGGFPYTMPADAARMTADLQPFYPGASVTAVSNLVWEIIIPGVNQTAFGQLNSVSWPTYLVADMFGVVNSPVSGINLSGNFVNAAGLAIYLKGFARLKITAGTRYDPYH